MRKAVRIELAEGDREVLERWSRSRSATVRLRERSRIVLMAAGGMTNIAIARKLGTHTDKVGRWRRRYADKGIRGIEKERPRGGNHGGRCPKAQAALRTEIIRRTTQERPPDATHWSCRSMARAVGTTHSFVNTVWRSAGLKPHLWRTFKVSTDPRFEEKLGDVVALYLDPPDNAAVFSFDEKSSVQALDRTQPGLPLKPGRCGTMTHDYKRHGTTSLFVAMDGPADPHHPGQLRDPQAPQGQGVGREHGAGPLPLRPDELLVAESGRALLQHADAEADPPRRLPLRRPPRIVPEAVRRDLQREPPAVRLDEVGRADPGEGGPGPQGARGGRLRITILCFGHYTRIDRGVATGTVGGYRGVSPPPGRPRRDHHNRVSIASESPLIRPRSDNRSRRRALSTSRQRDTRW